LAWDGSKIIGKKMIFKGVDGDTGKHDVRGNSRNSRKGGGVSTFTKSKREGSGKGGACAGRP